MSFFLRRAKFAVWRGKSQITDEDRASARGDFLLKEAETDGLSVFEIESQSDRGVVIAAIACHRMNTDNVDLLEIAEDQVRALGDVVRTSGGLPVPRANALHRSLPWKQEALDALAVRLLEGGLQATRYRTKDVRTALAELSLEDVDAGTYREWVASIRPS